MSGHVHSFDANVARVEHAAAFYLAVQDQYSKKWCFVQRQCSLLLLPAKMLFHSGDQMTKFAFLALPLLLGGCVTSIVKDVLMLPVKVVSKTADVLTTSQSEIDEKRGRDIRKREELLGKLARKRDKAREDCADGNNKACDDYEALRSEIDAAKQRAD